MYKIMVCNGEETWVAKRCRTYSAAVRAAERIKNECLSIISVWIE